MAGAWVQNAQNSSGSTGPGSIGAAFGSNNTAGNLIFAVVSFDANGGTGTQPAITLSDSQGNSYAQIKFLFDSVTEGGEYSAIYYAQNVKAGANTVTATVTNGGSLGSGYFLAVAADEYSGVATSGAFTAGEFAAQNQDPVPTSTNGVTSGSTPTPSSATKLAICFTTAKHTLNGTSWLTAGTGFTQAAQFWNFSFSGNNFGGTEYKNLSSATALAGTWTSADASNMDTYIALFNLAVTSIIGSGAITAASDTASGTGQVTITGTGAITAAADAASGTGIVKIIGTGAITAANDTVAGVGTGGGVSSTPIPPEKGLGLTLFRLGGHG